MEDIAKAKALFEHVFGYKFHDCKENRIKIHCLMYVLNELGMTVGNFDTFMGVSKEDV